MSKRTANTTEDNNDSKRNNDKNINIRNRAEEIIELMKIHSSYIHKHQSAILWIRNIHLVTAVAIVSKVYLNQIDSISSNNIPTIHAISALATIFIFYYINEASFQFWQAHHLSRMNQLDRGLLDDLFGDNSDRELLIDNVYTEKKDILEKINRKTKRKDHKYQKYLPYLEFLWYKHIPNAFGFHVSIFLGCFILVIFITQFVDC